jgi:hypothetical protein
MSGPGTPPIISQMIRSFSPQPAPRSENSQRIMAARRMNVDPAQVTQQPGYRPSGVQPPVQAAPSRAAIPPTGGGPIPTPVPRPQSAPPAEAPRQAGASAISSADFVKKALEMEAAKRNVPLGPVKAGPPVSSPEDFIRQAQTMQARQAQVPTQEAGISPEDFIAQAKAMEARKAPVPTQGTREATPEEIQAAQQTQMAQKIAAQRSGGDRQAAPASQGVVTPPAPLVAPSPASPPPPVGMQPREDLKGWVDPAKLEASNSRKGLRHPKSTRKGSPSYGANMSYYAILGVSPGDDVAASRALTKLREREKKDPGSITMEEDKILAASGKIPAYNEPIDPASIKSRFEGRAKRVSDEVGGESVVSQSDPAQAKAYATIQSAGTPPKKKAPTQEDVNQNPGAYKKRSDFSQKNSADVEGDTAVQVTENEE